jgi:ketosteroid isomerase-like protein
MLECRHGISLRDLSLNSSPLLTGGKNIMTIRLPRIINDYVNASNAHDVKSVVACFADNALVHDEGKDFRGKKMIEDWITKTIEKYEFQFKPISVRQDDAEVIVAVEVSGTFDGGPITLDYHVTVESDKILSLTID